VVAALVVARLPRTAFVTNSSSIDLLYRSSACFDVVVGLMFDIKKGTPFGRPLFYFSSTILHQPLPRQK
jgi:hypothetical protein